MTHRCTLHVLVDDRGQVGAVVEAVERLGHAVECPVFDEWSRLRARDELLREAHGLMSGTPWGRCVALEREIATFEAVLWPRLRERERPPETLSQLRRNLFHARKSGPLPTTARQLRNIIAKCGAPGDFREKAIQSPPDPR